jgi:hypothetical protein
MFVVGLVGQRVGDLLQIEAPQVSGQAPSQNRILPTASAEGAQPAIAAILGATAGTALFTTTPWAHGSVQVVIWVAAAVALVVCLVAIAIGPGELTAPPARGETKPVEEAPLVEPISGGPENEGYMGRSDDAVKQAREKVGLNSPRIVPGQSAGRRPAS